MTEFHEYVGVVSFALICGIGGYAVHDMVSWFLTQWRFFISQLLGMVLFGALILFLASTYSTSKEEKKNEQLL